MKVMMLKSVLFLIPFLVSLAHCVTFTIDPQKDALFEVSDKFLSVALDISNVEGDFPGFNLTDPYLTKLISHLSPMHFRVGGTFADKTGFSEDKSTHSSPSDRLKQFEITLTASQWLKLYQFTTNAGVRLIYDLNSLLRNQDGSWNSTNAEQMIKFSNQHQMDVDWELGNEPDFYPALFNTLINGSQLAQDIQKLRGILDQYDIYKPSYLVGIDMFDVGGSQDNQNYLSTFLNGASSVVHAVTWHQYYFAGKDATEELFLSPATFNYLAQRIGVVKEIVETSGSGNKIWLGETSSAYNGGAANMSNRFIGCFLWLDKLGLGAKMGLDVIIRQTIFHDNYAMLDNDLHPNPDWWLSVLYKNLVGTKVISITSNGTTADTTRLYAHCAKDNSQWSTPAVVVFGFNVANETASVDLSGFEADDTVYSYEFAYDGTLYSQNVRLNGEVLTLSADGELPDLISKAIETSQGTFSIKPYSIVFWVFAGTNVDACS